MIVITHDGNKLIDAYNIDTGTSINSDCKTLGLVLFELAKRFPNTLIIWCNAAYVDYINRDELSRIFHHRRMMVSYSLGPGFYFPEQIGFIDQSIFINPNKKVSYPTWLMSSDIGGIYSEVLSEFENKISTSTSFDYFLNGLSKIGMPQGLFCYSNPRLLKDYPVIENRIEASLFELFKFVKQHYKIRWVFVLIFCFIVFEKSWPLFPFLNSFRFRRFKTVVNLSNIPIQSTNKVVGKKEIDVIIPTIGRKKYLLNVLEDLAKQTILPKNVIIVEQNPDASSNSDLDYLFSEDWPFEIKHHFTHMIGVCNARNIALKMVVSDWVFLSDDDIRIEEKFFENSFKTIEETGVKVINMACLLKNQKQTYFNLSQTPIFGSGTSLLKSQILSKIKFDILFEHGFGEDADFGMQIRNLGEDVIYEPKIIITHLKAPIGGFRLPIKQPWDAETIQPKPSPTIMIFQRKYLTKHQLSSFKLLLFVKFYKNQSIKNPITYMAFMERGWRKSLFWANNLMRNEY